MGLSNRHIEAVRERYLRADKKEQGRVLELEESFSSMSLVTAVISRPYCILKASMDYPSTKKGQKSSALVPQFTMQPCPIGNSLF